MIAEVTSKVTTWPGCTGPTVERTAPSITGRFRQVVVSSLQPQALIRWMRPPESPPALKALATCSCRRADTTGRVPTPLTLTRKYVCSRFVA